MVYGEMRGDGPGSARYNDRRVTTVLDRRGHRTQRGDVARRRHVKRNVAFRGAAESVWMISMSPVEPRKLRTWSVVRDTFLAVPTISDSAAALCCFAGSELCSCQVSRRQIGTCLTWKCARIALSEIMISILQVQNILLEWSCDTVTSNIFTGSPTFLPIDRLVLRENAPRHKGDTDPVKSPRPCEKMVDIPPIQFPPTPHNSVEIIRGVHYP
jgi:hypothetical protein